MRKDFFLKNLWLWKCGLPENIEEKIDINKLAKTEWSIEFEKLMRNRLILGAYRYGVFHKPNKPKYGRVEAIIKRINKYKETGNKEYLVDVANFALCEFVECLHPNAHFKSIDDDDHASI